MSKPIIEVRSISKRYRLGAIGATSLRDAVHRYWRHFRGDMRAETKEFWALRDVSFDVQQGEVVGIIGRNGAGKSTILKILSRITEPSSGTAVLRGRVASLLEVGTGFHPELTGRDNIFLNGAIMGMTRNEVRQKFDEIVAFAEVEQFIDTPVKRYSSGMYVRLAFAVAAHLEPEILIVDEVLAVGDVQFQQKCLGKMHSITREKGRTVLFVSHNVSAIRQLCTHGLLLRHGRVVESGDIRTVIESYGSEQSTPKLDLVRNLTPERRCSILAAGLSGAKTPDGAAFSFGASIDLTIDVCAQTPLSALQIAVRVSTIDGTPVVTTTNADADRSTPSLPAGDHRFHVELPRHLAPGHYSIIIALCDPQREVYDESVDELGFVVDAVGSLQLELRDARQGVFELTLPWERKAL